MYRDDDKYSTLDIPEDQASAVAQVLACTHGKTICVKDIRMDNDEDKLSLVLALHEFGTIRSNATVFLTKK